MVVTALYFHAYFQWLKLSSRNFLYFLKGLSCLKMTFWSVPNPSGPATGKRETIDCNFYFHASFWWCLKRFYEDFKGLRGTTRKCKNNSLSLFLFKCNFLKCTGRANTNIKGQYGKI